MKRLISLSTLLLIGCASKQTESELQRQRMNQIHVKTLYCQMGTIKALFKVDEELEIKFDDKFYNDLFIECRNLAEKNTNESN